MRGSNTLFSDVFDPLPATQTKQKKGRSADLISLRNNCLIDRYFYYGMQRLSYTAILETIGKEFFVSVHTIPYIVSDYTDHLHKLRASPPKPADFKKKWPHLVW